MELSSAPTDAELLVLVGEVAGEVQRCRLMLATAKCCTGPDRQDSDRLAE